MKTIFITKPVLWKDVKKSAFFCKYDITAYEFIQSHDEFRQEFHFPERELPVPEGCIAIIKWERERENDKKRNVTKKWCDEFVLPKFLIAPLVHVLRTTSGALFDNYDTYGEWQKQIECDGWTLDIVNRNKGPFWDNRLGYEIELSLSGKIPDEEKKYQLEKVEYMNEYDYETRYDRWTFTIDHYFCGGGEDKADFLKEKFEEFFEPYLRALLVFVPDEEKKSVPDRWYGYSQEEYKKREKAFSKKNESLKIYNIKYVGGKYIKECIVPEKNMQ